MDKYKRYYGLLTFLLVAVAFIFGAYCIIQPKVVEFQSANEQIVKKQATLEAKQKERTIVQGKLKKINESSLGVQKKVYAPVESDLGNDTLFFTLYNDVIEMLHVNSVKIKSIDYEYNPKDDAFVKSGKDYFVCDVNVSLVSNYTNLGKLIQELYQYPYYIKINKLDVKPYPKDKTVLVSDLSFRLYAYTEPQE